jgi:hypothetical protein
MGKAIDDIRIWFGKLPEPDKKEVVEFLYGGKVLVRKGMYVGPDPNLVQRGLYVGPAPPASANVCEKCGRPF